jgi:hypothetical protein
MALKISRILHAGYVFECNDIQIAFDPIFENPFSRNCHAFPDVQFNCPEIKKLHFEAVFISHYHDDHCSLESLDLLDRKTPIYLYCLFQELFDYIKELGFINVYALEINHPIQVGPFEIRPWRALDADVDSLFQIKVAGLNVLNVVDSWIDYETLDQLVEQGPWDLVMWPFQTMRELEVLTPSRTALMNTELPTEWIDQLKILTPRFLIASSCQFIQEIWSWYNQALFPISYKKFKAEIEHEIPKTQVLRLNPSASLVLDKHSIYPAAPLSWVLPVGDQEVDYNFNKNLQPPSTAEISRHFTPLTLQQRERVFEYCQSGLIEKYKTLESPSEGYFAKPRLWRLSVFDHNGLPTHFFYQLSGGNIELALNPQGPLAWSTEVPVAKLFGALESGEALTSMYIRLNDQKFLDEIEKEIQHVDVLEDPLIRCLFDGSFGTYQLAQLKKIKARESLALSFNVTR